MMRVIQGVYAGCFLLVVPLEACISRESDAAERVAREFAAALRSGDRETMAALATPPLAQEIPFHHLPDDSDGRLRFTGEIRWRETRHGAVNALVLADTVTEIGQAGLLILLVKEPEPRVEGYQLVPDLWEIRRSGNDPS